MDLMTEELEPVAAAISGKDVVLKWPRRARWMRCSPRSTAGEVEMTGARVDPGDDQGRAGAGDAARS